MLQGKRALVTGAASGIGRGIAELFVARGASVLMVDVKEDEVEKAAAEVGAEAICCDVTVASDVQRAVAAAVERLGGLDVMVNNAGVEWIAPIVEHDEAAWDRVIAVNLKGPFLGIKYGAPAIAASGGGVIINMSSLGGLRGVPLSAAYGASKAGLINLTQTAAIELRPLGVRVNAICPGPVDTPMLEGIGPKVEAITGADFVGAAVQLQGRMGTPTDVARAAAFLASDEADLINGIALSVDGGMAAKAV